MVFILSETKPFGSHEPANYQCPFCRLLASNTERDNELVLESEHAVGFFGLSGNDNSGPTLLIATREHYENIYELPSHILSDVFSLAQKASIQLKSTFSADGITLLQHNEPAGNQDVWHFHLHIKARHRGDRLYANSSYRLDRHERSEIIQKFRAQT